MEDFDWSASITLDRARLLDAVFSLEFLDRHEHVLNHGGPKRRRVGKSFFAQAPGLRRAQSFSAPDRLRALHPRCPDFLQGPDPGQSGQLRWTAPSGLSSRPTCSSSMTWVSMA